MKKLVAAAILAVPAVAFAHPGHDATDPSASHLLGSIAMLASVGAGFAIYKLLKRSPR